MTMTVLAYFIGSGFPADAVPQDRREAMASMPLDSNCGDDCRAAIDHAKDFSASVRMAFGDGVEMDKLANILAATCGCFITG